MADPGTERPLPPEDMPRLGPTWSRGGGMFKPPKRPQGDSNEGARGGLEALANATTNMRMQGGGGPRDGNGMGGSTGAGHGNSTGALGATMGSVRVAAGPPPSASTAEPIGPGMGTAGRWERDREARTPDKRKVRRFTPEELMALRKVPTRPLRSMPALGGDISVIVSAEVLEPVTATPVDQDEVNKIWTLAADRNSMRPRRTRWGPGGYETSTGGGGSISSTPVSGTTMGRRISDRNTPTRPENEDDPWDDLPEGADPSESPGVRGVDLVSMAQATDKFQEQMDSMARRMEGVQLHEKREEEKRKARDDEFQRRKNAAQSPSVEAAVMLEEQREGDHLDGKQEEEGKEGGEREVHGRDNGTHIEEHNSQQLEGDKQLEQSQRSREQQRGQKDEGGEREANAGAAPFSQLRSGVDAHQQVLPGQLTLPSSQGGANSVSPKESLQISDQVQIPLKAQAQQQPQTQTPPQTQTQTQMNVQQHFSSTGVEVGAGHSSVMDVAPTLMPTYSSPDEPWTMASQGAASVPPASRRASILTGLGIFSSSGLPAGGANPAPTSTSAADPVGTLGLSTATPSLVGEPAFPMTMGLSNGSRDSQGIDLGMGRPPRDILDPINQSPVLGGVLPMSQEPSQAQVLQHQQHQQQQHQHQQQHREQQQQQARDLLSMLQRQPSVVQHRQQQQKQQQQQQQHQIPIQPPLQHPSAQRKMSQDQEFFQHRKQEERALLQQLQQRQQEQPQHHQIDHLDQQQRLQLEPDVLRMRAAQKQQARDLYQQPTQRGVQQAHMLQQHAQQLLDQQRQSQPAPRHVMQFQEPTLQRHSQGLQHLQQAQREPRQLELSVSQDQEQQHQVMMEQRRRMMYGQQHVHRADALHPEHSIPAQHHLAGGGGRGGGGGGVSIPPTPPAALGVSSSQQQSVSSNQHLEQSQQPQQLLVVQSHIQQQQQLQRMQHQHQQHQQEVAAAAAAVSATSAKAQAATAAAVAAEQAIARETAALEGAGGGGPAGGGTAVWYYLDPQSRMQGPFSSSEMRSWWEAGYFQPSLPVRRGEEGGFVPLERVFPGEAAATSFLETATRNEGVRFGYPRAVAVPTAGVMRSRGGVGGGRNIAESAMSSRVSRVEYVNRESYRQPRPPMQSWYLDRQYSR